MQKRHRKGLLCCFAALAGVTVVGSSRVHVCKRRMKGLLCCFATLAGVNSETRPPIQKQRLNSTICRSPKPYHQTPNLTQSSTDPEPWNSTPKFHPKIHRTPNPTP